MNEVNFRVGVKGLIVQDNKVLILKARSTNPAFYWDTPGGGIQNGETIEQALTRELHEELPGISQFQIGDLVHARLKKSYKDNIDLLLLFYRVTAELFEITLSDEHIEHRWVSIADIKKLEKDPSIPIHGETLLKVLE